MRHKKILKEKAAAATTATAAAPAKDSAVAPSGDGEPGTDAFDPNDPPKPLADMSMPEQL